MTASQVRDASSLNEPFGSRNPSVSAVRLFPFGVVAMTAKFRAAKEIRRLSRLRTLCLSVDP